MKIKKILSLVLSVLLTVSGLTFGAFAQDKPLSAEVHVTVAVGSDPVLVDRKVNVKDRNSDGKLTVDEALYAAHEAYYPEGAEKGYGSSKGSYGTKLDKLWGVENGGSYGYYVNNAMAMSLDDPVKNGDYIKAYTYQDTATFKDAYSFFDQRTLAGEPDGTLTLTLKKIVFDAAYVPSEAPVSGAYLVINGKKTEFKTDADGKVTFRPTKSGQNVITAASDTEILVPAVCTATVSTNETATVTATLSDGRGTLVVTQESVKVSDIDKNGVLTVYDALYALHEAKFEGGAEAGFAAENGAHGLYITKLWGIENGGSYGYYVNNAMAMGLSAHVKEGDFLNAFIYQDTANFKDIYCYFDANYAYAENGQSVTLTLMKVGFDPATYAPTHTPVANATILVNGEKTEYKTNADGKVTVPFDREGVQILSAVSETDLLVPPVCRVNVTKAAPAAPQVNQAYLWGVLGITVLVMAVVSALVAVSTRKRRK